MGANNSTRRVSFESDENDNITVVKGIRVSDRADLLETNRCHCFDLKKKRKKKRGRCAVTHEALNKDLDQKRAKAEQEMHAWLDSYTLHSHSKTTTSFEIGDFFNFYLKKLDAFYREQVARLEERSAQFYKVTTENYHKAADNVNAKFKRYEVHPVCGDLQGQILGCYKDNAGKTLNCSNIAALYLQCVNNAKQVCEDGGDS
uniref:Coiled-coil-helix-coiled-coil-helix domain containing 3a n=1 Tax=Fundulus heteroclitus TaxID=8078 RepID=A0A3Q2PXR1_FUNHE